MEQVDITGDKTPLIDIEWRWYTSLPIILAIINALLGLISFEWAWYTSRHYRNPIPKLESMMPAYRRIDAHKWRKWAMYPGAMTILYPRLICATLWLAVIVLHLKILQIG